MTKLFISFKFDDDLSKTIATQVKDELRRYGVQAVIAGDLTPAPPPEAIRSLILASDGLLAIITSAQSDWIQNEIGIAYAAYPLKIWGLVKDGVPLGGILPRITTYVRFQSLLQFDLKKKVAIIASELLKSSGLQAVVDQTEMLTGSTGTLQIAIKPRRIPSGDDIINVYIPPEFVVTLPESDENAARTLTAAGLPLRRSTDIPGNACNLFLCRASEHDAFPGFTRLQITLTFPQVASHLSADWAEFKLNYTAPTIAGTYRFFGTEQVSIAGSNPQDASPFEFEQMIVKGEISPVYLSGILFTSPNVPLKLPGIVSAEMTTRVDPHTGADRGDLPNMDAKCYLSASDEGRYKISGIAPDNIYASAIPFSRSLIASGLRIFGQPKSLDGQVNLMITTADNAAMAIQDRVFRVG